MSTAETGEHSFIESFLYVITLAKNSEKYLHTRIV